MGKNICITSFFVIYDVILYEARVLRYLLFLFEEIMLMEDLQTLYTPSSTSYRGHVSMV